MTLPEGHYFLEGVPVPETPPAGEAPAPWGKTRVVGTARPRVDGYDRLSGAAVYPSDVHLPGMIYGQVIRCPHPHALLVSIDTSKAAKMPGVHAVITGEETREIPWTWQGRKSSLLPEECRFEGEAVAAVAAETPYQAADAAKAIEIEWETLPFTSDYRHALDEGAAAVHESGNRVSKPQTSERGDVEKGFKAADVVRERTYSTACELHTPMELHGCVASWDGPDLSVYESTQGVFAVRSLVAKSLSLPLSRVRVIGHYVGGGFGSKLMAGKYTLLAALLAKKAARPVKVFLPREDTFLSVGNRPPSQMTLRAGVTKDGKLTALTFKGIGTGGAWPAGGTSLLDWLVRDLYLCDNVRTETTDVFTNAGPARPFRAPGHPQCAWALEQMMDELAMEIGMNPVELRQKNVPEKSQVRNQPYTTTGLSECLRRGAEEFGFAERKAEIEESRDDSSPIRRGVGMAGCLWIAGGGGPPSTVILKLHSDGSVNLNLGASDIGTGTKTVMAMVAAEELGVDPGEIRIENADTGTTPYATPSGGSKTVPTEAPTVRAAAVDLKRKLLDMAAEELGVGVNTLSFEENEIVSSEGDKRVAVTKLEKLNRQGDVVGIGYRGPNPQGKVVNPFAAQFCEVEVDTLTGEVKVVDFLGAHESGRVLDRLTFDNQVFGGITMGVGLALTEFRVLDDGQTGKMLNRNWHDYKLPTALDVPAKMTSLPIEMPDAEANLSGAKGLGEPVTIPTAAAIANAVFHATGVRPLHSPVNTFHTDGLVGGKED